MSLSRDAFLNQAPPVPTKDVPVPEWGDGATLRLRCLTSGGRLEFALAQQKASAGEPGPDPTALLVVLAAVDDSGARLFQTQDVDNISEMSGDVIGRLAGEVLELSGLTDQAAKDAEGNSEATPSGDSPSDSPETSDAPSPS